MVPNVSMFKQNYKQVIRVVLSVYGTSQYYDILPIEINIEIKYNFTFFFFLKFVT